MYIAPTIFLHSFLTRIPSLVYWFAIAALTVHSMSVPADQESKNDLLDRLATLEQKLESLQIRAASEVIKYGTDVYQFDQLYQMDRFDSRESLDFVGYLRFGFDYNEFTSQSTVSSVGGNAEESLRRLDELLEKVEAIVEESESQAAQELLNEARFFRNEAEIKLGVGDTEEALQDMSLSEFFALQAAEEAGEIITSKIQDEQLDGFTEVELQWNLNPDDQQGLRLINSLREGDEYFQERFEVEWEYQPSQQTEWHIENDLRIRDYQDRILDDFFSESLLMRYRWRPDTHWTVRFENDFDLKSEFQASPNEGFWTESPRMSVEYKWNRFHSVQFEYQFTVQEFLSREEKEFNSLRHELNQRYEYYGLAWRVRLEAEQQWRDFNRPMDEDDYRHLEFQGEIRRDLTRWLAIGVENRYRSRRYELRADTNTDYQEWDLTPRVEFLWNSDLSQSLQYRWTRRDNRDEEGEIDKSDGNFAQHRFSFETWWNVNRQLNLSATLQQEWRWYKNSQTGNFEPSLSDFRSISNYVRKLISVSLNFDWNEQVTLSGSFYYSREDHARFSNFDLEDASIFFEVEIAF